MKRTLQNILLIFASLIFSFIILESVIRVIKGEFAFENFSEKNRTLFKSAYPCQYDQYLGWIPLEGFSGSRNVWGSRVTILKDGIRSNGDNMARPSDSRAPILAVGDSFTFGDGVSDSDTWPALLEKISKRRVINGGVFGYALDQIFLRADRLIKVYRPAILILSFIPDDIYRCALSERAGVAKPYFDISGNKLVLRNVPVPEPEVRERGKGWLRKLFGYSLLVDHIAKRIFPGYWLQHDRRSVVVHSDADAEEIAYLLLRRTTELIKENRVQHIIILVQYKGIPKRKEISLVEKLTVGLNDASIKVIDLRRALIKVRLHDKKRWRTFFKGHMTPMGNNFVASEVQEALDKTL